jgi:hypothetical protein
MLRAINKFGLLEASSDLTGFLWFFRLAVYGIFDDILKKLALNGK